MNVIITAYCTSPSRGTEPSHGWNWATGYARRGHRVHLVTSDRLLDELRAARPLPAGLTVHPLPSPVRRGPLGQPYVRYLAWQWQAREVVRALAASGDVDLIQHVSLGSLFWGSAATAPAVPFIFGPVGGGQRAPAAFAPLFGSAWRRERLRTLMLDYVLPVNPLSWRTMRRSALVLATNRDTAACAHALGARRVEQLLDTGVYELADARAPRAPGRGLQILWVGRLAPLKGLLLGLAAFERFARRREGTLTIVGDGPQAQLAARWVREHELERRVAFRGHVPFARMSAAYEQADVLLFTSLRDSFGVQVLEALAAGLPVVALDHHGVRDFVPDDAAIKVPVANPETTTEALAEALVELHDRPERHETLRAGARRAAARHAWDEKIAWVEAQVLSRGPGRPAGSR